MAESAVDPGERDTLHPLGRSSSSSVHSVDTTWFYTSFPSFRSYSVLRAFLSVAGTQSVSLLKVVNLKITDPFLLLLMKLSLERLCEAVVALKEVPATLS